MVVVQLRYCRTASCMLRLMQPTFHGRCDAVRGGHSSSKGPERLPIIDDIMELRCVDIATSGAVGIQHSFSCC